MTCAAVCSLLEKEHLVHSLLLNYKVTVWRTVGLIKHACVCECVSLRCFKNPWGVSVSRELPSQSHSRSAHLLILNQHYPSLSPLLEKWQKDETCKKEKNMSAVFLSLWAFLSYVILFFFFFLNISSSDDNEWLMVLWAFIIGFYCCFVTHQAFPFAWNSQ